MKKTKELKFLKDFQKEIKTVTLKLEDFNNCENLQDDFISTLIFAFGDSEQYLYELQYEIDVDFKDFFEFLLENNNKLKSKTDKEFYWMVVQFILYKVINLQNCDIDKLASKFDLSKLNHLFSLLEMSVDEFSSSIHSFLKDYQTPGFGDLSDYQIFYCLNDNNGVGAFTCCENPDLNHESLVSDLGEIVVLDHELFSLSEYKNISEYDIEVLHSKFLRLFANNYLYVRGEVSAEFLEAKESVKKDKTLQKCFVETMNKNLFNFSSYRTGEILEACALGTIPVYPDLLEYLEESGEGAFVEEAKYQIESRR